MRDIGSDPPAGRARAGAGRRLWLRRPRLTLRLRLTLLYGACFLAAGAALLTITYVLVARQENSAGSAVAIRGVSLTGAEVAGLFNTGPSVVTRSEAGAATSRRARTTSAPPGRLASPVSNGKVTVQVAAGPGFPAPGFAGALISRVRSFGQKQLNALDKRANRALATQRAASLDALLTKSAVALGVMALLSIGLGWLVAGRALRPLRTMNLRARSITEDNLHERLGVGARSDELGELAGTFDGVLGRLERAFDAQRRFVANASHELRTPVTLQRALVEVALADPGASTDELRRTCERVLAAGEQQERVIEALLTLARGQAGIEGRKPVDLAGLTAELLDARAGELAEFAVERRMSTAVVTGDPALLERLAANLLDNAVVHNAVRGAWIRVVVERDAAVGRLRVANGGPEISPERVPELFEPFRRLGDERTGRGLGLGLSIVRAIAVAHGGTVEARPVSGGGLEVEVSLPLGAPRSSVPALDAGELPADPFAVQRARI